MIEQELKEERVREQQWKMEEQRQKHEMEMLKRQQEFDIARREEERKKKIPENLLRWDDGDEPKACLLRFEGIMKQAEIPQAEWPNRL